MLNYTSYERNLSDNKCIDHIIGFNTQSVATAPAAIATLSLHDALPISETISKGIIDISLFEPTGALGEDGPLILALGMRSEEHTSELQSRGHLVCRLLLEKKKTYY